MQKDWLFLQTIFIYWKIYAKKPEEEKRKEDEQTEFSSAHRHSQAKYQLVQTGYINLRINFF